MSSTTNVRLHLQDGSAPKYEYYYSGGVYKISYNGSSIGTAKTEEQAMALIKAHVSKPIRRVEVY